MPFKTEQQSETIIIPPCNLPIAHDARNKEAPTVKDPQKGRHSISEGLRLYPEHGPFPLRKQSDTTARI
jgi:hypothetical protein